MARKSATSRTEKRRSIKISASLYDAISKEIRAHPEWGIGSVSEFIRRAIDHELSTRRTLKDRKTVELILSGLVSQEGSRDRGR